MFDDAMNVGSTVRARRRARLSNTIISDVGIIPTTTKYVNVTHRAVIATIESNGDTVKDPKNTSACLIWESKVPRSISMNVPFIISPTFDSVDCNVYEDEEDSATDRRV